MKKIIIGILIAGLYGFPFVYFSMHQDFVNGSMLGYLIMIVMTSLLAFFGKLFSHSVYLWIGNLLSVIVSLYFNSMMNGNDAWGGYFKPLSPSQLVIFVSLLNMIPQFFAIRLANRYNNTVKNHRDSAVKND